MKPKSHILGFCCSSILPLGSTSVLVKMGLILLRQQPAPRFQWLEHILMFPVHADLAVGSDACCPPSGSQGAEVSPSAVFLGTNGLEKAAWWLIGFCSPAIVKVCHMTKPNLSKSHDYA